MEQPVIFIQDKFLLENFLRVHQHGGIHTDKAYIHCPDVHHYSGEGTAVFKISREEM
jgi:hypothetical protein